MAKDLARTQSQVLGASSPVIVMKYNVDQNIALSPEMMHSHRGACYKPGWMQAGVTTERGCDALGNYAHRSLYLGWN